MIFGGWIGASSLASSIGTRSGGIESGMIEPHGSLARGGVPSREEITSPFSVVSTRPWWTRFDNWKRQYFIRKPIYRRGRGERREMWNDDYSTPKRPRARGRARLHNLFLHRFGHQELLMHLV